MGKLTDKFIKATKGQGKDQFCGDGGGLYLRITPAGSRLWVYRYKNATGITRWFDIGAYPSKSLAQARAEAATLKLKRREGVDPTEERERQAEALLAAKVAGEAEQSASNARLTVMDLFERWERRGLNGRKDKGAEVRRSFEKDVLPVLGAVFAEDVKRGMVAECLDTVAERGAPVIARNLLGDLRQMFGYAIKRGYVENDPTSHLKRDDFGKKIERERVLDDAELRMMPEKLAEADMQEASIASVWIMLSTCCRVGEISQARWEHIDLNAGTWWLPPANTKNAKEHTVVMSDFAKVHFQELRRLVEEAATREGVKPSPWVLPASRQGAGHVCLKSLAKQIGDRQRGDKLPMMNRTKLTHALELPKGKWTPHDLRRTGATIMGKLGVRPDVIEKCLNHVEQNRLIRIYQRQTLEAEQTEAWRLLGERLELLTLTNAVNVVVLEKDAA